MYAEMGNYERTEMQLKFQDSPNPSVLRGCLDPNN